MFVPDSWPQRQASALQLYTPGVVSQIKMKVTILGSTEDKRRQKTHTQNVHGIIPGFGGDFVYVFSHHKERPPKHINNILLPTQSWDNPENLFMFMCFSFPDILR